MQCNWSEGTQDSIYHVYIRTAAAILQYRIHADQLAQHHMKNICE